MAVFGSFAFYRQETALKWKHNYWLKYTPWICEPNRKASFLSRLPHWYLEEKLSFLTCWFDVWSSILLEEAKRCGFCSWLSYSDACGIEPCLLLQYRRERLSFYDRNPSCTAVAVSWCIQRRHQRFHYASAKANLGGVWSDAFLKSKDFSQKLIYLCCFLPIKYDRWWSAGYLQNQSPFSPAHMDISLALLVKFQQAHIQLQC